jgi:peptide/nickel transport system substrate-binding protein
MADIPAGKLTMKASNRIRFAALLLAAAGFCASAEARTLRWARSIDATTLDPHAANTGPNLLLLHQIYEPADPRRSTAG